MEALIAEVNWLAVVVGAVAAYLLGWFWYSQKGFGKKWMEGLGHSMDQSAPSAPPMVMQAIGTFLLAWVIGITETTNSLSFAILIALTVAVIVKAGGMFAGKSKAATLIDAGYVLAMVVVMIAAHAIL